MHVCSLIITIIHIIDAIISFVSCLTAKEQNDKPLCVFSNEVHLAYLKEQCTVECK